VPLKTVAPTRPHASETPPSPYQPARAKSNAAIAAVKGHLLSYYILVLMM
jgi:hypothetical protein